LDIIKTNKRKTKEIMWVGVGLGRSELERDIGYNFKEPQFIIVIESSFSTERGRRDIAVRQRICPGLGAKQDFKKSRKKK